jgi:hypothetical protein
MRQRDFYNAMLELRAYLDQRFTRIDDELRAIRDDIAGIKVEAALHRHDDE